MLFFNSKLFSNSKLIEADYYTVECFAIDVSKIITIEPYRKILENEGRIEYGVLVNGKEIKILTGYLYEFDFGEAYLQRAVYGKIYYSLERGSKKMFQYAIDYANGYYEDMDGFIEGIFAPVGGF